MLEDIMDAEVVKAIRRLNEDIDRCVMIGRNALNLQLKQTMFTTVDYDIMCHDLKSAMECQHILEDMGFRKHGATFIGVNMQELDVIIGDPNVPAGPLGEFYNSPELHVLWERRETKEGIRVPSTFDLILNRLLTARENAGRDIEVVSIYFKLRPDEFSKFLEAIEVYPEYQREKMLFSLYQAVAENPEQRQQIETAIMSNIRDISKQEQVAQINKADLNELESATALLKNQRATDNTTFKGHEITPQQNDTVDLLEQIKKHVQADKAAMAKLESAGLSPEKDITVHKVARPGKFFSAETQGLEVVSRTRDSLMLIRGRCLFIYELKLLELQAPAQGIPGEKLDLEWPKTQEKARGAQAQEQERKRTQGRGRGLSL